MDFKKDQIKEQIARIRKASVRKQIGDKRDVIVIPKLSIVD